MNAFAQIIGIREKKITKLHYTYGYSDIYLYLGFPYVCNYVWDIPMTYLYSIGEPFSDFIIAQFIDFAIDML